MNNPLKELVDAEDFFNYYNIPYNKKIVSTLRLHILKLFRKYLAEENLLESNPDDYSTWIKQRLLLIRAYLHFFNRTGQTPEPLHQFSIETHSKSGCSSCSNTSCKV